MKILQQILTVILAILFIVVSIHNQGLRAENLRLTNEIAEWRRQFAHAQDAVNEALKQKYKPVVVEKNTWKVCDKGFWASTTAYIGGTRKDGC